MDNKAAAAAAALRGRTQETRRTAAGDKLKRELWADGTQAFWNATEGREATEAERREAFGVSL